MMNIAARLWIMALLLGGLVSPASAQWRVTSQSTPTALGNGATFVRKTVSGPADAKLKLVFFDASQCALRVVGQKSRTDAVALDVAMRAAGAIAGCNGAYFTPEFTPLGLEISSGTRTGKLERSSLLGGVLMVRKGRPTLLWRDEFTEQTGITDLVQAGPRLVNAGQPVKGLEATKSRARTFVLTDCAGHWAIGTADSLTLRSLSDLLSAKGIITEFEIERALNLDGGRSTGLWFRPPNATETYHREFTTVRNFIALLPK